jgi:hypothetical protein
MNWSTRKKWISARRTLFARHAFGKDFALNNFVGWLALHHARAGKLLSALRTGAISVCAIFGNSLDKAFY